MHSFLTHQATGLDAIADLTVEASENVRDGNEQVRGVSFNSEVIMFLEMVCRFINFYPVQAIKNRASLRIWILFILIVCSFALLFLDWYN